MADHFIGRNRGTIGWGDSGFTYGTSTGATDVEVRIADGKGLTRKDVILILERIEEFITAPDPHIAAADAFPPGF